MKTLKERYLTDPQFNFLVKTMVTAIESGNFTPTEMREASMLASILVSENSMRHGATKDLKIWESLKNVENEIENYNLK